jgi:hypothetical protein
MQTEEKPPANLEQLKKLRRELLHRIVQNEARRKSEVIHAPKEARKA